MARRDWTTRPDGDGSAYLCPDARRERGDLRPAVQLEIHSRRPHRAATPPQRTGTASPPAKPIWPWPPDNPPTNLRGHPLSPPLLGIEAELLDASGRREEALAAWSRLKDRDPDDLSPYFISALTLEPLGRYREAAAEWRHIISSLEAHDDAVHTTGRRRYSKRSRRNSRRATTTPMALAANCASITRTAAAGSPASANCSSLGPTRRVYQLGQRPAGTPQHGHHPRLQRAQRGPATATLRYLARGNYRTGTQLDRLR